MPFFYCYKICKRNNKFNSKNNYIMNKNIFYQQSIVSKTNRQQQAGHKGVILWFTGLSGAGKSTVAHAVEKA
jgi:ABC-type proline/glycine betaine transport system ATPase subunit